MVQRPTPQSYASSWKALLQASAMLQCLAIAFEGAMAFQLQTRLDLALKKNYCTIAAIAPS